MSLTEAAWEQRYGIDAASLERQPLASAVPPGVTLTLAPVPAAASEPTPVPARDYGEWQFGESVVALTQEVRKFAYSVAHTVQGVSATPPRLFLRCTVGRAEPKRESYEVYINWFTDIGNVNEYDEHPVEYRVDDSSITDSLWNSSTNQRASFAYDGPQSWFLVARLRGFVLVNRGLDWARGPEATEFAARVTRQDNTTITGVWNITGMDAVFSELMRSCGIPDPYGEVAPLSAA